MTTESVQVEITQDDQQLMQQAATQLEKAEQYKIDSPDKYTYAGDMLRRIKRAQKQLDEKRKGIVKPLNEAKARIQELFKGPLNQLGDAERAIKQEMGRYDREVEAQRRKAQAEAEEKARKERERIAARAEKAKEKGQEEKAAALEEQAQTTITPVVSAPKPKAEGISTRTVYKARVTDKKALIEAVAAGSVPDSVLVPDQKVLDQMARALKDDLNYPGVTVETDQVVSARA